MKKRFLLTVVLIVTFTFLMVSVYNNSKKSSVSIVNALMKQTFNKTLLETYMSSKGEEKKQLEEDIKTIAMKDMGLDKWLDYNEYVKLIVYPVDIIGDSSNELVIGLNLSKNLGTLGIYKLEGENYLLDDKIDNLTNIEKISGKRNTRNDKRLLFVEEL